jgi:hypothetical protein
MAKTIRRHEVARRSIVKMLTAGILISLLHGCMYLKNYGIIVISSNEAWGGVFLAGTQILAGGDYGYGEVVNLEAYPTLYCSFDHWEGDLSGTNPIASVTMDANKDITAVFTCRAGGVAGMAATYDKAFGVRGVTITLNDEYIHTITTVTGSDGAYSFPPPVRFGQVTAEKNLYTFVPDPSVSWTGIDDINRYSLNFLVSTFYDKFEDPSSGWTLSSGDSSVSYYGGALSMSFTVPGANTLTSLMPIPLPNPDVVHHTLVMAAMSQGEIESLGITVDHGTGYVYRFLVYPGENRLNLSENGIEIYADTNSAIASPFTITVTEDSFIIFDVNGYGYGKEIPTDGWAAGSVMLEATNGLGEPGSARVDFQSVEFAIDR